MTARPVPPWWPWAFRLRLAAGHAFVPVGFMALVRTGDGSAGDMVIGAAVGAAALALVLALRGPSSTELQVAWALRSGDLPSGLSLALVDTEAARRSGLGRWSRLSALVTALAVVLAWVVVLARGPDPQRVTFAVGLTVATAVVTWAVSVSVREARRWAEVSDRLWATRV